MDTARARRSIKRAQEVFPRGPRGLYSCPVSDDRTTAAVQRYLDELAGVPGDAPAEPVVRELLAAATGRLHLICSSLLFRSYPRLTRGPLNLETEDLLDAVVARLIKAMRQVRPGNVRQFYALAGQHMRWELNDLARRLDEQAPAVGLRESMAGAPPDVGGSGDGDGSGASQPNPNTRRILDAIEQLPEAEREAFTLVRIQGMTQPEAATVIGVSAKTVQRRLNRGVILLAQQLADLRAAQRG